MLPLLERYPVPDVYDEFAAPDGSARPHYVRLARTLAALEPHELRHRIDTIDDALLRRGVTFTVYADARGTERILPFDPIPRIVPQPEWTLLKRGIAQRVRALNAFIGDVYHGARVIRDGIVPLETVFSSQYFCREMIGVDVPRNVYVHVSGIDVIRDRDGSYLVLEDNLRTPSGISYVLENRDVLKRSFPSLFDGYQPRPVDDYPRRLRETLRSLSTRTEDPTIVVLTPGVYNSAYYEHTVLARRMGVELVEGRDLTVRDDVVMMKTTKGLERVDVIYRRVDDDFLDPLYFRADSTLGVPGIFNAYRAGNIAIANAVGTGVADDKAIYPYVPAMIRYYLGEEPILANVPTFDCTDPVQRRHVVARIAELVVKNVKQSGGYGMLIGPASSSAERERFRAAIEAAPRDFIAQPVIGLSACPVVVGGSDLAPRHIDLRPFALYGDEIVVPPAALTRVALTEGSLVVNSSQGGGSKDTWILED